MPFEAARFEVEQMAAVLPFRLVPIVEPERHQALDPYQRYGKRSGHCARTSGAKLLYKGDDFVHTDLA